MDASAIFLRVTLPRQSLLPGMSEQREHLEIFPQNFTDM